jgi:predicted nucleic acid-binding protein
MLREWLNDQVIPTFQDRIIAIDLKVAQCCAGLHVPNPCSDRDALIGASALVHGMTVVTRNVNDFTSMGVKFLNPWDV